jgi:uncharacterized protein YcnI
MSLGNTWISRIAGIASGVTVLAALWLGAGIPSAWAHVHASGDNTVRGGMAIVTFHVPNESITRAATTALTVLLPNVAAARTESIPGWTAKLDRDAAAGTVRSVTWTAVPDGGIGPDQFGLFRISLRLPNTDTVSFPVTQTYADGSTVKWDQPPASGGAEPEHPAPVLALTTEPAAPADHHHPNAAGPKSSPDNTARLLGGAALVAAGLGICLALLRRRA